MGSKSSPMASGSGASVKLNVAHESSPLVAGEAGPSGVGRSRWYQSTFILMAEIMGAGILGLPYALSRLGWVVGLLTSVGGGVLCTYSGVLLSRAKHELGHEGAESYYDLALATGGRAFGDVVRGIVYLSWAAVLPYFLLACVDSLRDLFPAISLPIWQWALVVCAFLLAPLQLRTLHQLSYLALPSTVAVIAAVTLVLAGLVTAGTHSVWIPPATAPLNVVGHVSAFVFAYMGHSMYFEVMREMQHSSEFSKALIVANAIMASCYTLTSVLAYAAAGDGVAGFLPDSMPDGPAKQAVGLLLAFHTAVSYLVQGQPLTRAMQRWLFPSSVDAQTARAATHWFGCTSFLLLSSMLVAVAIPFFSDLQQLLGSFLGAPLVFGCPAFFFLASKRALGTPARKIDLVLCVFFLFVLMPTFAIVGTTTSLLQIRESWQIMGGISRFIAAYL